MIISPMKKGKGAKDKIRPSSSDKYKDKEQHL